MLSFCLLRAEPEAYGSSQARGRIGAAYTTATQNPSPVFDLHHSSQHHQILNPLSGARDRTHILMERVGFVTAEPRPNFHGCYCNYKCVGPRIQSRSSLEHILEGRALCPSCTEGWQMNLSQTTQGVASGGSSFNLLLLKLKRVKLGYQGSVLMAQEVKQPVLSLQLLGSLLRLWCNPWPGNFHMPQA